MDKKKKNTGMKGFEELYENYLNEDEYSYRSSLEREREKERNLDQYELQHFLELENTRLANLEAFFTNKIPAKINFSQTEKLIIHQVERKEVVLEKIVPALTKLTSQCQLNMAQLFNAHFG
jgi:hypothetical protein